MPSILELNKYTVTSPYADNSTGRITTNTWDPGSRTRTIETTLNGQLIDKSVTVHTDTSGSRAEYTRSH